MRIITGLAKNKPIKTPKGQEITRPALAKVREAIFSSLGDMTGQVILDVFAGSGSLALEGLSRGAKTAYFIESHPQAIKCIIENLKNMGFDSQACIFKRTLPFGLSGISLPISPDIIFCDPPYDKKLVNATLEQLLRHKLIAAHSVVVVEHSSREVPDCKGLQAYKQKQYGQTFITYLKPSHDQQPTTSH